MNDLNKWYCLENTNTYEYTHMHKNKSTRNIKIKTYSSPNVFLSVFFSVLSFFGFHFIYFLLSTISIQRAHFFPFSSSEGSLFSSFFFHFSFLFSVIFLIFFFVFYIFFPFLFHYWFFFWEINFFPFQKVLTVKKRKTNTKKNEFFHKKEKLKKCM